MEPNKLIKDKNKLLMAIPVILGILFLYVFFIREDGNVPSGSDRQAASQAFLEPQSEMADKVNDKMEAYKQDKLEEQEKARILRLRQKRTVIRQLTKQITAMSNLRGSLACLPVPDKGATHTVDETIKFLEKKRDRLQAELTDLVEVEFSRQLALLTTIKGIGITLATALIITTGGFTYFQNAKQVSRYLGICPTYEQSGTSVNIKGHINRNGDAYTRGLLYIAAWPASRFNAQCKETYTRLRQNGKSGKLAMIAVANKLIRQAFAVVAHDKEYIDGFVSNRP